MSGCLGKWGDMGTERDYKDAYRKDKSNNCSQTKNKMKKEKKIIVFKFNI